MNNLINYLSKKSLSLWNGSGMTRKRLGIDSGMTRFSLASLICLCMLTLGVGNAWGATATMTGLTQATSSTVNSKAAIKCGTGNYAGSMKVTVPANATVLALYCAGWNGASVTINITPSAKVSPSSFNPTSDSGISGGGTSYTLSGSESTYLKTITLSSITSSTDITFANTAKKKQFVIWGARYVFNPTSPTNGTPTSNSEHVSWSYANSTDKYEIYYSTSSSAPTAETAATTGYGYSTIGTTKSADLTGLTANTTYYWWVRAVDPDGYCKSAWVAGSSFTTSAGSCTAPSSVSISGTTKYLGGQTISLTATPTGGSGTTTYQWEKKISGTWTPLSNGTTAGVTISGATTNNLTISPCTHENSGGYRCVVSTGATCSTKSHADDNAGYGIHVFSIHGKYSDGDYEDHEITWTSGTTGTKTLHLNAKKTYLFKIWSNNGYYYGHGAYAKEDFMFQPTTWDCGVDNREMRLFTTVEGDYTFTVNIEHGLDGSPYVVLQVGYPSMTHPNTGYVYVQKFSWQPYLHYWYNNDNKLTEWNDDPQLASDQYVEICGTNYWCVPVIDYYCNFIAADHNGQTTGDQHTNSPHPGQKLYNDGSWQWGNFTKYTISYAAGTGGSGSMSPHSGLCPGDNQALSANDFKKDHYHFTGWVANVDVTINSATVTAGTLITGTPTIQNVQSDITLTAQWEINSNTLTWNWGGGSTSSTSYTLYPATSGSVNYGTTIAYPANNTMTKDGYAFTGWSSTPGTMPDNNLTLTAQWQPKVTWMAGGEEYRTQSGTAGTALTDPGTPATGTYCDGVKVFVGWTATEIDGTTDDEPNDLFTSVSGKTIPAGGTTYYAVFATTSDETPTSITSFATGDYYLIAYYESASKYYAMTGSTSSGITATDVTSAVSFNSTDEILTITNTASFTSSMVYTISGTTSAAYIKQGVNDVGNSSGTSFGTLSWAVTSYDDNTFRFSGNSRCIMFKNDPIFKNYATSNAGNSGYGDGSLYLVAVPPYSEYATACAACTADPSAGTVALYGSFSLTSVGVQATEASAGTNCHYSAYGFLWSETISAAGDLKLNEGTGAAPSGATKVAVGTSGKVTSFTGALEKSSFEVGHTYYYRSYVHNNKDAGTYQYSSVASFTPRNVSFNMHGHGGDAPATQVVPQGGKATDPGDPSETGYTFDGWWDNSSYTGSAWDFSTNTVGSGGVTLYAKWTEKPKYTITLNAGNGTVSADGWTAGDSPTWSKKQANGDEEITLPTPSCNCAGWVFQGWSTTSKDNAASFTPDKEDGASFVPGSNVTYYAVYRQNASGGTTYNKITSTGDLTTGDYLFVANGGYAMKNAVTSNRMEEVSGFASSEPSLTTENSAIVWTIIKFSSQVVIKNGSNYIGIDANNKICLTTTPHFFTYTYNGTNSRWEFTSAAKTDYQLAYSTAHGGAYAYFCIGTSQSTAIYLYKQGAGLTGNYYTNPTCSDYTINGVADPAAGGTVTLSAASAKTDDKVYALYTLNKDYNFVDWEISGTGSTLSSTTALITEITVGSANTTVTANFELKEWAVTWKANGETLTGGDLGDATTRADTDEDITELPPSPSSCDGTSTTFMGWVEESEIWSGKTDDVSEVTIYSKVSDFPAVTGNVTYHAVWAKRNGSAAPATYAGTGTFTRITTLEELEVNAHYVLYGEKVADSSVKGAMNNTFSNPATGKYIFGGSSVSISEGKITNPAATIVWKLGGEENAYTLYSQNSSKYIEITANDARAYSNPSEPTTSFTIAVSDGNFKIKSNHKSASNRMICLYTSTEFRSYSPDNTDYVLYLYKYGNDYTYNKYLVKCCEDPELAFDGEYNYQTLVRQDIHGAHGGNGSATVEQGKATLVLDYATESDGTCTVEVKKLTGGDNRSTAAAGSSCANHTGIAINESTKKVTFDVWTYAGSYPTANGQGTYRIKITQDATSTYCAAETYYFVDVTLRDKFVDAVNGNATINVDGQSKTTSDYSKTPTEASLDGDKNDDCHETTRRFLGWVREDQMDTWYGSSSDRTRDLDDKKDDAALVAPNTDIITSGSTWYAVWGIEE